MTGRAGRVLIAIASGIVLACVSDGLLIAFPRLVMLRTSALVDDSIIGFVVGLCAYAWASLLMERKSRQSLAQNLRQEGVLRERKRLAREIHDTLAQGLSGIVVNLEAADEFLGEHPEARRLCERALRIARESLAEARSLLKDRRPSTAQNENLCRSVMRSVEMLIDGSNLEFACSIEEIATPLPSETEVELLRIIREAVTNVVKHARASELRVSLRGTSDHLELCVEDNGCGFVPGYSVAGEGFGLTSMAERVNSLGGISWFYSELGQGTAIVAVVPISSPMGTRSQVCDRTGRFASSSPTTIRLSAKDLVRS